jgi:hypothetical protein
MRGRDGAARRVAAADGRYDVMVTTVVLLN